ncbi:putative type VI secretion system effector [Pseudescherichia vulneris]
MTSSEQKQVCSRFVKPEKLADLRTKQEIELMNGRPWTRQLPPPPVLPPYGPLEKISGRLEAFSYESFREYFDVEAYRTSTLPTISDGQRAGVAAAAIAAGSPGVGAVIMAESESSNDTAEYVQGIINGRAFRGWVGITRLQEGDDVEMVAEWQHDHYEVYAIALPKERIVSIIPKCDMGHISHALWRIKNMFILTTMFMFMFILVCFIKSLNETGWANFYFWKEHSFFLLMMLGLALAFSGLIAFSACRACAPTRCKLAEEIFRLLGMKNASKVNLNKITKKREQRLMDEGKWHDPGDKSKPACPSGKFIYSGESWFYY